ARALRGLAGSLCRRSQDRGAAEPAPPLRVGEQGPGFDSADVPRQAAHLRRGHRYRAALHADGARTGGVAMSEPTVPMHGASARRGLLAGVVAGVLALGAVTRGVRSSVNGALGRLTTPEAVEPKVAIADQAEVGSCTARFKEVLERVLHSCG